MLADIIVILIILLCIFLGYKRGLIKVGVRIISFIAALAVALILYNPISNYIIENTEVVPKIENVIESKLYNKDETKIDEENAENTNYLETIEKQINNYTEEIKEGTVNTISHEISIAIVRIGTWIVLFIVTKILMIFVKIFANVIAEIPIIKQFNKARWFNLWSIRGIFDSICISCNIKCSNTNNWRK